MMERTVNAERMEQLIDVFGSFDENIKKIEAAFQIHVVNRGTELKMSVPWKAFWRWRQRERPSTSRRFAI